jgi:hypothetical protein
VVPDGRPGAAREEEEGQSRSSGAGLKQRHQRAVFKEV